MQNSFLPELAAASGPIDYPMTNDYIFRAVLQNNLLVLKALISALLHIPMEEILSIVITNPVVLGDDCTDKEFRLDINVLLNNLTLINLEMQMEWQDDWHERSLIYLCRNFDNLIRGQEYSEAKSARHIGILKSMPAYEGTEFYSENMILNVKTLKIYSDKFALRVLNLKQVENATAEDKAWGLDLWAKFFNASTWEELRMIAQNNEYLTSAANSIYLLNGDETARKRARDREDYYRDLRTWKRDMAALEAAKNTIAEQGATIAEQAALIAELQAKLAEKKN